MAITIKVRSGLEANRVAFLPEIGEILWTTDTKKLFVGDGTTGGGNPIGGSGDAVLLDNYVKPVTGGAIVPTDTVNDALGKLEVDVANAAAAGINVQSDWDATTGDELILNKPTIVTALGSLDDTTFTNLADGELAMYNDTTKMWENTHTLDGGTY